MNDPETTDDWAPHPWRIQDHDSERYGYLSIVDADGNKVCDFFPNAAKGGRGRRATLAIAVKILEWERHAHARRQYGLMIHDGGSSFYGIAFCPWCGARIGEE
jgi:hypothetical protein